MTKRFVIYFWLKKGAIMIIDDIINKKNNHFKNETKGLCSNCNNASTCSFIQNSEKTVLECEEYDCSTSDSTTNIDKDVLIKTSAKLSSNIVNKEKSTYKGLCVNCEYHEICKYPKPEAGVWHCEEYK